MRSFLTLFVAVFCGFLTGCASHSDLITKKDSLIGGGRGVVVVALGSTSMLEPSIDVITKDSTGKSTDFAIHTRLGMFRPGAWTASEIVRPGRYSGRRMLLAYSALPGNYSAEKVFLSIPAATGVYSGTVALSPPYRFEVEAGKITYLGVIEVEMTTGNTLLGELIPALSMQVPAQMRVRVRDEFEEDYKMLSRMRPELEGVPVLYPGRR